MRPIIFIIFSMSLMFSHHSFSKINDKRVYNNLYNSCIKSPAPQFNSSEMSTYCSCFSDNVTEYFTVKELMELEMGIIAAKDKEAKLMIAASNKKFKEITSRCLTKILN